MMRGKVKICRYIVSFTVEVLAPDKEVAINKAANELERYDPTEYVSRVRAVDCLRLLVEGDGEKLHDFLYVLEDADYDEFDEVLDMARDKGIHVEVLSS